MIYPHSSNISSTRAKVGASLLVLCLLALCSTAFANNSPKETALATFSASYKANIKGFSVDAKRTLLQGDNGQFTLTFTADSWAANVEEYTTFEWVNETIQPITYRYYQTAFGKKRHQALDFTYPEDNNKSQITINSDNNGEIATVNATLGTLDKLSYQLQLQHDIAKKTENLAYTIADKGRLKEYRFEILGEETLDTALGNLNTRKVKVIRDNNNKTTLLWFAQDWGYLLTRLEQYSGDKQTLTININEATVNNENVVGLSQ